MNVYDFDKTIYWDDSATDFYFFILKQKPQLMIKWPTLMKAFVKFKLKKITRSELKEVLYQYVTKVDNLDEQVRRFWSSHDVKLKEWYLSTKKEDDLIISASPEFIIEPICRQLNVDFMASRLNPQTGKYDGVNCYGEEKVRRFREFYPTETIEEFYSDSLSDTPLAKISKKAFLVDGNTIMGWPKSALTEEKLHV